MLDFIYEINNKLIGKDIFIWNVSVPSMLVLKRFSYRGVSVKGFVSDNMEYVGNTLFNKFRIISLEEFCLSNNVVMVVSNDAASCEMIPAIDYITEKEAFHGDVSEKLRGKSVFMWGSGNGAKNLIQKFSKSDTNILSFYQTKVDISSSICERPIVEFRKEITSDNDTIVVSVTNDLFLDDIMCELSDCPANVFVDDEYLTFWNRSYHWFVNILNRAVTNNTNIVFFKDGDVADNLVESIFSVINIDYSTISDVYDLFEYNPDSTLVVISETNRKKRGRVLYELASIGFNPSKTNVIGIQECLASKDWYDGKYYSIPDALYLATNRIINDSNCGGRLYGDSNRFDIPRIMILGGSTTDPGYFSVECWVSKLWTKLRKEGYETCILNCAKTGASVIQELIRFLRDSHGYMPDIVISMSGVNDMRYIQDRTCPRFNIYYPDGNREICTGYPVVEKADDYWIRVEKMIESYATFLGIKYYGILQPINIYSEKMSLEDTMGFMIDSCYKNAERFHGINNGEIINLFSLFHNCDGMFIDHCHYSEFGTDRLSDEVMKIIRKDVKELKFKKHSLIKNDGVEFL